MGGPLAPIRALIEALVTTFGPFLIPATVFVVGLVGYGVLLALTRWVDG